MLRAQGMVVVPKLDMHLGVNFQHLTGKPWMATTYVRLPQGFRRVRLEPRGARRFPWQSLLDLRLSKTLRFGQSARLEVLANLLNLLNETAWIGLRSSDPYYPDFGEPSHWVEPRSVMLGIKVSF